MRRWNGWGDDDVSVTLAPAARDLLERLVGPGEPPRDARLEDVVAAIPATRLRPDARLDPGPETRLRHATGQSLPDWVAIRSGRIRAVPDAVARPVSRADARDLLGLAAVRGARLVPYGGGTSVVGGVTVRPGDDPVVTVALDGLAGSTGLDPASGLATFGAGATGPAVEAVLGAEGFTLGHYPQSWELSTVGGWVAARSAGQESIGSGRIEALFAGGHVETPAGPMDLPTHPASAAGPDLRQLILGSEGRGGIITDVVVRARPIAETRKRVAYVLGGWPRAVAFARELARSGVPLDMVRVSTPLETATTFALAGDARGARFLRRYLGLRAPDGERCLAIIGVSGSTGLVGAAMRDIGAVASGHAAVRVPGVASAWERQRFRGAYLRNTLWDAGYAVDTLETAVDWGRLEPLAAALGPALRHGLEPLGERVHAFSHLSHVYRSGSSLYATYVFRLATDPDETLERWRRLKTAASEVIVAHGGTISHQHGVGTDHVAYLEAEKGTLGLATLRAAFGALDPDGIMVPGVLLADPS
jgi:alkyldihydroxyacetonephosphate synthase